MTRSSSTEPHAPHGAKATLPALLTDRAAASPNAVAQWRRGSDGRWSPVTWATYRDVAANLASALLRFGLLPGDRVGVMSPNSARWDWAGMAILAARGVVVGIDHYGTASQVSEIASRAGLSALVVRDADLLARFDGRFLASLRFILLLEGAGEGPGAVGHNVVRFDDLATSRSDGPLSQWDGSLPDDPAILIFTSGTTGAQKGILYRHRQVRMAIDAILEAFDDIEEGSRFVCWLPLANIFQRTLNLCAIAKGAQTYYLADPRQIVQELPRIEPDVFIGVPRFYEKLYEGITARLDRLAWPVRTFARWAMGIGDGRARAARAGQRLGARQRIEFTIANALVLGRIRKAVWGRRLRYAVSGSAPMPLWLLEGFHALGVPVLEGYAMSECMIPVASNRPRAFRFGTVGQPMRGNEIKVADDGELLLRGPGVFDGYFGEDTRDSPVGEDGFLATGDFAEIDTGGYITLTGRKSEVFKTSTGRRVAPAAVESVLRRVACVDNVAVFGAGRKSLVAVLCVSPALAVERPEEIGNALQVAPARLRADVDAVLLSLPAYLRPTGYVLTRRPFTIEGGELTANLKLRRAAIATRYGSLVEDLYAAMDDASVPKPFLREVEPGVTWLVGL